MRTSEPTHDPFHRPAEEPLWPLVRPVDRAPPETTGSGPRPGAMILDSREASVAEPGASGGRRESGEAALPLLASSRERISILTR